MCRLVAIKARSASLEQQGSTRSMSPALWRNDSHQVGGRVSDSQCFGRGASEKAVQQPRDESSRSVSLNLRWDDGGPQTSSAEDGPPRASWEAAALRRMEEAQVAALNRMREEQREALDRIEEAQKRQQVRLSPKSNSTTPKTFEWARSRYPTAMRPTSKPLACGHHW